MGFFRKLFNRFKLTQEQKHIKKSLQDPLYREVKHKVDERGKKIKQEYRKNIEKIYEVDV